METLYADRPDVYDALYAWKDYDGEVAFVCERFDALGNGGDRVLVVGCGTGEHGRRLHDRGFDVVGVDRYPAMVERARTKSDATFVVGALPELPVAGRFDLVWLPFTVVNHLDHETLAASVEALAGCLEDGGVLAFDDMPAGVMPGQTPRLHTHPSPEGPYARLLDVHHQEGDRYRWDSLVFTPDGEFFADAHELTDFDRDLLADVLRELGLTVHRDAGYDASGEAAEADGATGDAADDTTDGAIGAEDTTGGPAAADEASGGGETVPDDETAVFVAVN